MEKKFKVQSTEDINALGTQHTVWCSFSAEGFLNWIHVLIPVTIKLESFLQFDTVST